MKNRERRIKKGLSGGLAQRGLKKGAQWWVGLKKRQPRLKKGAQWCVGMKNRQPRLEKGGSVVGWPEKLATKT